ncbi:MAG: NAD-dependent epimerase/dehydratase family protein [Myxococcota bacterium]
MKVLFVGGTGIISSACSALAVERGIDLYLLLRGKTAHRAVPKGARVLQADIGDPRAVNAALGDLRFDAVVNFIVFSVDQLERDLELFARRTRQYVFISSASAYQTPPSRLPVTESTLLHNPHWQYSRNKIACEERLVRAYRETGFPATIVRPSHTYDCTLWPAHGGYTVVDRMRRGKPVIVHGDGSSLWTLTHHRDFARAFVPLLGHDAALGEAFHITSDEALTWDRIHELMAYAAGAEARIVHVPSDLIACFDPEWGASLLGDKTHSMVFDNTKVRRLVPDFRAEIPFARGVHEIMAYYDADPARRQVDTALDQLMDRIIAAQEGARPRR